jgi:Ca2+-binding EF-hand superfamily protein
MVPQAAAKKEGGTFKLPSPSVSAPAPALLSSRSARPTPRSGPKAKALPGKPASKSDPKKQSNGKAKVQEKSDPLPSAESLLALASAKMAEAAELEAAAQSVHELSLERQVGSALAALNKPPAEVIREWQANKDKMALIEMRQAVRNRLKIRADNKAIDALFASLDTNRSGTLDATQIKAAVKMFTKATKDANKEAERHREAASSLRAIAEQARVAGDALARVELQAGSCDGGESEPETAQAPSLQQRVVLVVLQGALSTDKLMGLWDKDRKGTMTSKQLTQALRDIRVQAADAEVAELHSELAAATNAAAGAPLSTKHVVRHFVDLAKAEGARSKERESQLKHMRKEARQLLRELEEAQLRAKAEPGGVPLPPTGDVLVELASAAQALSIEAGNRKGVRPSDGTATGSEHSSPLSSPGGAIPCSARKRTPSQDAVKLW